MYTIKQASIRTGVSVPLLRAWERRYGIPSPARTSSGYRLYDDAALARVRQMKSLVTQGWAPSQAAKAVLEGRADGREATTAAATPGNGHRNGNGASPAATTPVAIAGDGGQGRVERFVEAASRLDEAGLDDALAEAFASLRPDEAIAHFAMPALVAVGEAWSSGDVDVAAEHAASSAVMRRLGTLYEAAGQSAAQVDAIVGLPPRARHEAGALAFAVVARRAGIRVLYLGADVPLDSWLTAARSQPRAAIVLAAVTRDEAASAREVALRLRRDAPNRRVFIGGASAELLRDVATPLPQELRAAVAALSNPAS